MNIHEALGGGGSQYPINNFEKYPISLKKIWQISQKFRMHCIPISLKFSYLNALGSKFKLDVT